MPVTFAVDASAHPPIQFFPERIETTQRGPDLPVLGSSLAAILHFALEHDRELMPSQPSTLDDYAVIPLVPQRVPPARKTRGV